MTEHEDPEAVERAMQEALERTTDEQWAQLWAVVDRLAGETTYATWAGGEPVGTTQVDGEERPVIQMPYPEYSDTVGALRRALGRAGMVVPFDWMGWDGIPRYRGHPDRIAAGPVTDAVRLLTAIQRSERFGDGSIEGALKDGTMQAALARVRRWHEEER